MFASLNMLRIKTMKTLNVETFEFSESYLQFFDKMEKANSFLENIIETKNKDLNDIAVYSILNTTISDGGYWCFFAGLASKYGLVPKEVMPETFHSSDTDILNEMLDIRLRKAAMLIRNAKDDSEIEKIKENALYEVYNICVKAIGMPPKRFTYTYKDKDKKFVKLENITPLEFLENYTSKDILDKCEIVADPRGIHEIGRVLELPYATSVKSFGNAKFLNVPLDELKRVTIESIKDGIPVWFGCDVAKESDRKKGIMDSELFDYNMILTDLGEFSKADRLMYRHSNLTHAMSFVGVDLDENGMPITWAVENSWGDSVGKDGIFSMSDKWFEDHTYSVVVDRKYIDEKLLKGYDLETIKLDILDPLA